MNYLKKGAEAVAGLLFLIGFFLLLGTAGASDLADEMGEYFSIRPYIPYIISGFVMMGLSTVIMNVCYEERDDENGTE